MIAFVISSIVFLIMSIIFLKKYNSGRGGALGSKKKKVQYIISIVCFILFIIFSTKAYYYNRIEKRQYLIAELNKAYREFQEYEYANGKSPDIRLQYKISELQLQMELNESDDENDIYFDIFISFLSAFVAFVIAFTFKNRILG
jgi:hypothetical protein